LSNGQKIDAVTFEVLQNALVSVVDNMALTVLRTAHSGIVKDAMDYSTALCDRDGTVLAQGLTIVLHLGSFPDAVKAVIDRSKGNINPGDIFILNDPYLAGGIHLPDIYVIRPIFTGEQLECFVGVVAHHTDVGGIVPGSNSTDSVEIYQEGLRIPVIKLVDAGVENRTMFDLLMANVRLPDIVWGDLQAQISATATGEREYLQLVERYTSPVMDDFHSQLLDYSERLARSDIDRLPDGEAVFTGYVDADNIKADNAMGEASSDTGFDGVKVTVRVSIIGDEIHADFEGSSPQVKAGINSPLPFSKAGVFGAVRLILNSDIPTAAGYTRAIKVTAPESSVVNPSHPAPCGARGITGFRIMDSVMGALAQIIPDRVPADGEGGNSIVSIGGRGADGEPFGYVDLTAGARGGGPDHDGAEGVPHPGANIASTPVEVAESELPIRFEEYSIVPDSGGAGKFRGGMAQTRKVRLLEDEAILQLRSDKRLHPPFGLQGGKPGSPSSNILRSPDGESRSLRVLGMSPMQRDEVIDHTVAGGGGWGNPLDRDMESLQADLLDEKITVDGALADYSVVADPETLLIDAEATRQLRSQ
jgi:N-methylhydantoinase B